MLKIICSVMLILSSVVYAQSPSASLGEALSQKQKTFAQKMPKEVIQLHEQSIKDLKKAGMEKQALKVGDKVPNVQVEMAGKKVDLSQIYGVGPLVIKFYRGGWCPYCMTEIKHYDKMSGEFKQAGAQILAISPDTKEMIAKSEAGKASFDAVSDNDLSISRKFGLVYKMDPKVVEQLKKDGMDLSVYQGNTNAELVIPATYVVDTKGKIVFAYVDADYRKRAEPSVVLKAVKSAK